MCEAAGTSTTTTFCRRRAKARAIARDPTGERSPIATVHGADTFQASKGLSSEKQARTSWNIFQPIASNCSRKAAGIFDHEPGRFQ